MTVAGAAGTLYAVPVVAAAIGWSVLGEVPGPVTLVGEVLALTGVALSRSRPPREDGGRYRRMQSRPDIA